MMMESSNNDTPPELETCATTESVELVPTPPADHPQQRIMSHPTEDSTVTSKPRSTKASVDGDDYCSSEVSSSNSHNGSCGYHQAPTTSDGILQMIDHTPSTHTQHRKTEGVFPIWTRMTDSMHHYITRFVVTLAVTAASRPRTVISAVILMSLALVGTGLFTNFHINVEETEIYAPFNSIPQYHMEWRDDVDKSGFLPSTRVTTIAIHANGANILGKEPMERVFTALDTVRNISGYKDICADGDYYDTLHDEFTCRIIGATRFWYHDTQLFYEQAKTEDDVIQTLSQTEYPPGIPADHEYVLGTLQRQENNGHGNGTITYVPAYFVYILLSIKEDKTELFELDVVEQLSKLQSAWDKEEGNILQLEFFAERSFSDEFTRAIEEDMFLVPVGFIMMAGFTCVVFFQSDRVQSRSGLGVGSVTTIAMSLMSGFGILFICGVPYTSMTTILPFIVFGVGLDDTFIIMGSYLRTDNTLDTVERVRLTMEDVGTSITTTTVTTMTAFILGLTSSVPAIYWLCLCAFPTIFIDFIYQITFFVAIVVLDEERIKQNREDICCCAKRPDVQLDGTSTDEINNQAASVGVVVQERHIADRIMASYAKFLMRPVVKGIVIVMFAYFFALCVYRTTMLTQEFDVTDLFPIGSYATDVLDAIQTYQERSLQVEIYFRDVNQSDPVIQSQMLEFVDQIAELPPFGEGPPVCWVRDFQTMRDSEYFSVVADLTFEEQVAFALEIPEIKEAYGMDIVHENGNISASRCIIVMRNSFLDAVDDQISVLNDQRAVTDAFPINQGRPVGSEAFFTFNQIYLMWEFYNIAVAELITTTVTSIVAVSIVALVFIPHWSALFFIVPMVAIVYIDLLGTMQVAGLHINAVTYVCLVISIGLIVDFLLHINLRYYESTFKTRDGKVKDTLETMGSSILLGGLSTFLGVIPLAFSSSTILRTVFTSLVSMVVLGVAHGLVLLPVVLSVIGPYDDVREDSSRRSFKKSVSTSFGGSIKQEAGYTFEVDSSDGGSPVKELKESSSETSSSQLA
ncbi:Pick C1-like protein 1 [Seminavis robusta]|uniref:Pick C1-like protein 1 n=1 Tax=Seminavis robusta TaxID=568900 RepID=A0A9N8EX96_9STRA|nr:Pick C1-like protein 1 [Seminavis robusta]|eukprot:Sro2359_g324700.1 Pick C1-like protein 1 (1028) ;mRNA; r:3120-6840